MPFLVRTTLIQGPGFGTGCTGLRSTLVSLNSFPLENSSWSWSLLEYPRHSNNELWKYIIKAHSTKTELQYWNSREWEMHGDTPQSHENAIIYLSEFITSRWVSIAICLFTTPRTPEIPPSSPPADRQRHCSHMLHDNFARWPPSFLLEANGQVYMQQVTLPETNIAPENGWLEDVFPIEIVPFRGHVSFRECNLENYLYPTQIQGLPGNITRTRGWKPSKFWAPKIMFKTPWNGTYWQTLKYTQDTGDTSDTDEFEQFVKAVPW